MKLPKEFLDKMQCLLGKDEYKEFILSYSMPRHYGIRVNTLKISVDEFMKLSPFNLERIPWVNDGFYYQKNEFPGRHPFYYAGLYYIQEPSAMLPAAVLDAKPGEYVLDLCAAPGGKAVQIAAGMKGEGLLIANDVNQERLKALIKNIELCGVKNAVVTNEQPQRLSEKFSGFFDKILVDAPCSGEGMFRKDENAVRSWEKYKCNRCQVIQKDILEYANIMLKPGGRLVYSTCTFSPEEDEIVIGMFLKKHSNYVVVKIPLVGGIENGRPEWFDYYMETSAITDSANTGRKERVKDVKKAKITENIEDAKRAEDTKNIEDINSAEEIDSVQDIESAKYMESAQDTDDIKQVLKGTVRLWPHKIKGEGHFIALLEKSKCDQKFSKEINNKEAELVGEIGTSIGAETSIRAETSSSRIKTRNNMNISKEEYSVFKEFITNNLNIKNIKESKINLTEQKNLVLVGSNLYYLPVPLPELDGIKVVKFGWYLGLFTKDRFEPSHSFVIALRDKDISKFINFVSNSSEITKYLKGETIIKNGMNGQKGYTAVCVDGFTIGWAKQTGNMLKNLYPKGWRKIRE